MIVKSIFGSINWIEPPEPFLYPGDSGVFVATLQKLLNQWGASLIIDGLLGAKTQAALTQFQQRFGLQPEGIVNASTWLALKSFEGTCAANSPPLRQGDRGLAVIELQKLLQAQGAVLMIDGIFDAATKAAVIIFQQNQKLQATGEVDTVTWIALHTASTTSKPLQLVDACRTYNPLQYPHQTLAIAWLQSQLPAAVMQEFTRRWLDSNARQDGSRT
jgi:peptidoglycan hydrolase-like protein with peptidoglycan-binding domain